MRSIPDISVVILCYKAGDFVPKFVARIKKVLEARNLSYELVLVANFNKNERFSDSTPAIAVNLASHDPTLTVVAKEKEGMMGWDMRSGLEVASGNTIAVIDGDGQILPEDVIGVYNALKSGNFDMAKTYREKRYDGLVRLIISRIYNFLLKLLFPKVRVHDANSKPKIYTRDAYEKLHLTSNDWFIDAEMIIQASDLNFRIVEVPTVFYNNPIRPSFIRSKAILQFIKSLIIYRLKHL